MEIARALGTAVAFVLGRDARVADRSLATRVESLAWLPLVGAFVGALAALAAAAGAATGTRVAGAFAAVVVLRLVVRPQRYGVVWAAAMMIELVAVAALLPTARTVTIVVAAMLARWACVVQCYGGAPAREASGLAALAGRTGFREFGIASVTTLGTALVFLDAVGLAVAVTCAAVTLAVRTAVYARRGGIDAAAIDATSALVETSALVVLAMIGVVMGRG